MIGGQPAIPVIGTRSGPTPSVADKTVAYVSAVRRHHHAEELDRRGFEPSVLGANEKKFAHRDGFAREVVLFPAGEIHVYANQGGGVAPLVKPGGRHGKAAVIGGGEEIALPEIDTHHARILVDFFD